MMFHRTRVKHITNFKINVSNNVINRLMNTKFLGVIIDSKLNWAAHILYIKNKISKSIGIFFKIRNFLDKHSLRNMYFTFIYPYLIYCVEIWGNTNETHLKSLIKIQKRSIRSITFSHYQDHTGPLFDRLNILDLKKLVIQRIALSMFKRQLNLLPSPLNNFFTVNDTHHNHFTRQTTRRFTCKHWVKKKMYIDYSAFMVYTFGTIFQNKFPLMYHMLVIKTYRTTI